MQTYKHIQRFGATPQYLLQANTRLFSKKDPPKSTFNPFSVRLEKGAQEKKEPSTLEKLKKLLTFKPTKDSKEKSINDLYQEQMKEKKLQAEAETTQAGSDADRRRKILEMIDKNINRKYFSEKKIDEFFEQCFALQDPQAMMEDPQFNKFCYYDMKFIIQSVKDVENIVKFLKFMIFFRIDQDPEVYEILANQVKQNIARFKTEEILTILVNFSHSLSPEAQSVFDVGAGEFDYRLRSNFNATSRDLYIQPEDFPKIINTFGDHGQLTHELKQRLVDYLEENVDNFNYQVLSELAVLYSTKMDKHYKELFFKRFKEKFLKDFQYLDQDVMYKILWALVKGDMLKLSEEGLSEWTMIKSAIVKKIKDLDPKTITNMLVLSTVAKHDPQSSGDLFDAVESEVIIKMKTMSLSDLVNLLWSAQEINKGSNYFYSKLEDEIMSRIRSIKDEEFSILIECFTDDKSKFSGKFFEILTRVILEKRDKFELKTLVHLIWTLSKVEFADKPTLDILRDLKDYERLRNNLGGLLQKSQCILLWVYSREDQLYDKDFLEELCSAITSYQGPRFELDNFDILLLCQSINHLERTAAADDYTYMNQFYQLVGQAETFVIKNFERMSIHEFTTIMLFYLNHEQLLSTTLLEKFLSKMQGSVAEFNEFQLTLFLKAIISYAVRNSSKYPRAKFAGVVEAIDLELEGIQKEKEFIMNEDKIRDMIREQLKVKLGIDQEGVAFKPTGTEQDAKLEREVPKAEESKEVPESKPIKEVPKYKPISESLLTQAKIQESVERAMANKEGVYANEYIDIGSNQEEEKIQETVQQVESDDKSADKLRKYLLSRKKK